ncbi:GspE/PulE family protein (plasmid) [Kozakia baliensis]|uniref:GspE/PulE family protein n=1 Tax=Kozakia baliensis TaxID=153496 RepID=UPI00345C50A2
MKFCITVKVQSSQDRVSDNNPSSRDHSLDSFIEWLSINGRCDTRAIERARRVAEQRRIRVDKTLLQLGLISERELALAYADFLHLPIASVDIYPDEPVLPDILSVRFLKDARAIPLYVTEEEIAVALNDPLDGFFISALIYAVGLHVKIYVAIPIELDAALERLYTKDAPTTEAENDITPLEEDTEKLKDLASEAPTIRLVNQLLARAVETLASDIHIEPFEDKLRVRYRYDGVLHEVESLSPHLIPAVISRIKIIARLDIAERRLPQDGRAKLAIRGHEIDFRISTVPALHGETVVLRILDQSNNVFDYAALGLAPKLIEHFENLLAQPNGIILVTGPTGSGKTTTLYAGLSNLNAITRNVVTIEDPIEYQLAGVNQIQVKPQIGLTFATLLRSILRQDPDVVMVGEIRDEETAQIAVQAALTGHLVISTLHTNSAAAAIIRLRDMGIEDFLLTAVLRGIVAQRLIRRLCDSCKQAYHPTPEVIERLGLHNLTEKRPITLFHAIGCAECRRTGYRGRQAVAELLEPNEAIERLIFAHSDHTAIERAAIESGMLPMFTAGLQAALAGVTTIEEIMRSIRSGSS